MAGFAQNIFGRGKVQFIASEIVSFKNYFKNYAPFDYIKIFFVSRFQHDHLKKYRTKIKYRLSNEFMINNDKVLQALVEDHKFLNDSEKVIERPTLKSLQSNPFTTPNLSLPTTCKIPSSKKLLSRPWLIKIRTNIDGKPPILKCYAIDEEGEIIEVDGKPSLIPPILGPEAKQEVWKPKGWKPIRQTLKLHEIIPSPKCPKHHHLQKPKRFELIRETLLQATIVTTNKEEEGTKFNKEFTQDHFNYRLKKLSALPIPLKQSLPKEKEKVIKVDNVKENESSSTTESSSNSNSNSSTEKDIASSASLNNKKLEEKEKKLLEEKKKRKEKKKKIQEEKRRLWKLALREAAGQAGFMGTYATRVGGLGRPF